MADSPIATGITNTTPNSVQIGTTDRLGKPWVFSVAGLNFLRNYEHLVLHMYNDSANHATIGYGHLIHHGPISGVISEQPFLNGITEQQATELLRQDLKPREILVNSSVLVPLFQHEYDAKVIFCFNIGNNGFSSSGALRKLNAGKYSEVPDEMMKWNKAGGQVSQGLINRRTEEVEIFTNADYVRTR